MCRYKFLAVLTMLVAWSCSNGPGEDNVIGIVNFGDYKEADFSEMPSDLLPEVKYVILDSDSKEFGFTSMSKVICRNGKFYILDWRTRRIIVFGENGEGEFALSRRGRGPKEYLQISDFDIDADGGFWILDGQKDKVNHYLSDGEFVSSVKTGADYSKICHLEDGNLLFAVPIWDDSDYKEAKVVLADTSMTVLASYSYGSKVGDKDYKFTSYGFSSNDGHICLVSENIDDDVAVFDEKGTFEGVLRFDFNGRTVPDDAKTAVERHRKDFEGYSFLIKAVAMSSEQVVMGCAAEGDRWNDFVIDRMRGVLYKQSDASRGLSMSGISGGRIMYMIQPRLDEVWPGLPADIMEAYKSDKDIIAYRELK